MEIVFDPEQKKSGINKHGHYQFGKYTCQFCKNDDTVPEDTLIEHKGKKYRRYYCPMCNGKALFEK